VNYARHDRRRRELASDDIIASLAVHGTISSSGGMLSHRIIFGPAWPGKREEVYDPGRLIPTGVTAWDDTLLES